MRCVIEVAQTLGSAPREAGTRMSVGASDVRGSIGGGNLEYTALQIAREMLLSGEPRRERRFALGDSLGQCCGGAVLLRFTLAQDEGEDQNEDSAAAPSRHVVLFGAGHVGKEVARILERLPCTVTWVDPRPEQFPAAVAASVKVEIEQEPVFAVADAPPGASYLVMTHSHALDLEIVSAVLKRGDSAFLGLIGSATKAAKFRARLQARGIDASRLVCPIGLWKSGKHPAEIAVAVAAQLLAPASVETSAAAHPAIK